MHYLHRVVGSTVILLSLAGLILCIGGIFGGWLVKQRVDHLATGVLAAAEDSLTFVEAKLDWVHEVLGRSRKRVGFLSEAVERLQRAGEPVQAEAQSLLETLEEEVFEPLRSAEDWLDSTHAVAVGVGRVSEAVVSSDFADTHPDSTGMRMAQTIQEYSETVAEILATLRDVREELVKLAQTPVVARAIVKKIVLRLVDAETRLANTRGAVEAFRGDVGQTKTAVADWKEAFPRWTALAALGLTLLLAWFAFSQVISARYGWGMAW